MHSNERNLLILNSLFIIILTAMRLMVFGWILLAVGLFVILPIIILHAVSSTKGFMKYSKLMNKDKFVLFLSFFLFVIFILFQYEMDDRAGYMIIEALIRRLSTGVNQYTYDYSSISFPLSIISGLMIIIADIYILMRIRKIKQLTK